MKRVSNSSGKLQPPCLEPVPRNAFVMKTRMAGNSNDSEQALIEDAISLIRKWNTPSEENVKTILSTARKYLKNAIKEPWSPRFRSFRLSNKVADRITRIEGGLRLLTLHGFDVITCTGHTPDFLVTIPLLADLDKVDQSLTRSMSCNGR